MVKAANDWDRSNLQQIAGIKCCEHVEHRGSVLWTSMNQTSNTITFHIIHGSELPLLLLLFNVTFHNKRPT